MKTYARIVDGLMVERIEPAIDSEGKEIPVEDRFHPDIVATLVEFDPANPPPTSRPAPKVDIKSEAIVAVQSHLDAFARTRGYDDIASACTYVGDPDPQFNAEGICCRNARSATWRKCYQMLADVEAGKRKAPASAAEVLAELPKLEWPTA